VRRRILILGGLVVAALAALAVTVGLTAGGDDATAALRAAPYPEPIPAPATLGRDQEGEAVQVPRPGRPAVVTFLFANCPDVCPLVAQEISQALDDVGPEVAAGVDVVAISVDPANDTPAAVRRFLAGHRLTGRMDYIVGTRAELAPVWRSWGIIAQPSDESVLESVHTARIVLVDRDGRQLGAYPGGVPISIDDLAADIRTLAETS
jgi:protein SCO1/2